jgi:tripartite-type tricarboxylate transporter receptor subunit TctC
MRVTDFLRALGVGALASVLAAPLSAQTGSFPSRPITLVVPFAAGGGSDVMARVIAEPLSKRLGQPVVIENKPGANASIGAEFVAKSAPDGHVWLHTTPGPHITNPFLMAKMPYDPAQLTPVARLGVFTHVLAVSPSLPARSVAELVAYAKANPGKLSFASAGVASGSHLAGEHFKQLTGIDAVHVPYKGTGAAIQDLIGGNVQMTIDTLAALGPSIKAGRLRVLAVGYSARDASIPDVPTLAETFPGFDSSPMNYLSIRTGTPKAIAERINREINAVLGDAAIRDKLRGMGVTATPSSADEIARQVESERVRWGAIITKSGLKPQ